MPRKIWDDFKSMPKKFKITKTDIILFIACLCCCALIIYLAYALSVPMERLGTAHPTLSDGEICISNDKDWKCRPIN